MPDVGVPSDERLNHLGPHAADQDRGIRFLQRLGFEWRVGDLIVLALIGRLVLGEERLDEFDGLDQPAGASAGRVIRNSERVVLQLEPAGAQPEDQPPAADVIDRGRHFGDDRGVAIRIAGHQQADLEPLGLGGERGQQRPAFQTRTGRIGEDRQKVVEPEGAVVAEFVGLQPQVAHLCVGDVLRRGLHAEAEAVGHVRGISHLRGKRCPRLRQLAGHRGRGRQRPGLLQKIAAREIVVRHSSLLPASSRRPASHRPRLRASPSRRWRTLPSVGTNRSGTCAAASTPVRTRTAGVPRLRRTAGRCRASDAAPAPGRP